MHTLDYEYTDTFAGEANYCWVRRGTISVPCAQGETRKAREGVDRAIKKAAKAAVGLTGVRGEWSEYDFTYEFRPRGMCTVLFVTWRV